MKHKFIGQLFYDGQPVGVIYGNTQNEMQQQAIEIADKLITTYPEKLLWRLEIERSKK